MQACIEKPQPNSPILANSAFDMTAFERLEITLMLREEAQHY